MPREVRLGIVLYGGVSLAVYENGVAQELHRAVRNQGIYSLVSKLIDSRIVVDIISGTSAGGVNGVMLAYALAKQTDFAPSADLWRNEGDIMQLLRNERDPTATSVLNSSYYQGKLENCFQNTLAAIPAPVALDELDLFITGTDANGDKYTVYDDKGHAIDVKNHRALFKLSIRANNRKNDPAQASAADLATLARLTSCFPVAFEPVSIGLADKNFFEWGKLRKPAVYMDGGILNNKPFTSTIDAIATRVSNCDTERFLIYVEPDPEVFPTAPGAETAHSPSVAQAAIDALVSIPGYQSIAGDLQAIQAHNERAERIASILEAVGDPQTAAADSLDKTGVLPDTEDGDASAYLAARGIQIRDAAVASILNDSKGRAYIESPADRRSGRILVESFNQWPGDVQTTLINYDVFYRMRRAAHLSASLMRHLKAGKLQPETETWDLVNHYFKLYEMTRWAMVQWLDQWGFNWRTLGSENEDLDTQSQSAQTERLAQISVEVWRQVEARANIILNADIDVPAEPASAAREEFYRQLAHVLKTSGGGTSKPNLLWRIDDSFKAALRSLGAGDTEDWLRNEFCRFAAIDRQIFPVLFGSGSESTDIIRIVRFSPRDATRALSSGPPASKVCGSALGAFGGFFKKGWRANDIMIGRFDGCCQLIECLVTKERLATLGLGRTLDITDISACFSTADPQRDAKLLASINGYLQNPAAATQESWDALIDTIVAAAHDEIQNKEWPQVVKCSIEQEYDWSRYRHSKKAARDPYDVPRLLWRRARKKPDEVVMEVAAHAIASGQIPPFQPGSIAGRPFLDEIPQEVLQELASLAGIRVGRSLLASISSDETRQRIAGSAFYKWPFKRVLPFFYSMGKMRRTQPDTVIVLNTAIPVVCVVIWFVLGLLLYFHGYPGWRLGLWLALAPAVVFAIWWKLLRK